MKLPITTPLQNLICDTKSEPLYLASTCKSMQLGAQLVAIRLSM